MHVLVCMCVWSKLVRTLNGQKGNTFSAKSTGLTFRRLKIKALYVVTSLAIHVKHIPLGRVEICEIFSHRC